MFIGQRHESFVLRCGSDGGLDILDEGFLDGYYAQSVNPKPDVKLPVALVKGLPNDPEILFEDSDPESGLFDQEKENTALKQSDSEGHARMKIGHCSSQKDGVEFS